MIAKQIDKVRPEEGEWYFDPKLQRAFLGFRMQLKALNHRLDELGATPNVVSFKAAIQKRKRR